MSSSDFTAMMCNAWLMVAAVRYDWPQWLLICLAGFWIVMSVLCFLGECLKAAK